MALRQLNSTEWFEAEVKPHESALRGYLHRHVPEWADVDDVVQETYKRILAVHNDKPIQSVRGLLFAIAKNAVRDLFRKNASSKTFSVAEIEFLDVLDSAGGPNEVLCRSDEIEILKEAIQSLPQRCRMVLILRKFENLSHKEIASRMNISAHTVESQLTKALKKCEAFFERKGLL